MKRTTACLLGIAAMMSAGATPPPAKALKSAGNAGIFSSGTKINPALPGHAVRHAQSADGSILSESFETDETDGKWLPEGWSRQNLTTDLNCSWHVSAPPSAYYPAPADGSKYIWLLYSAAEQDEWLISPEIEPGEDCELSYSIFFQPAGLFDLSYYDEATNDLTEKHIAATLEIHVREAGGQWQKIKDIADDYMDMSYAEMVMSSPTSLSRQSVSLAAYAGKKIQFAFRYVGKDGDSMFLDAVRVGLPALEPAYSWEPSTLYWGTLKDDDSWAFSPRSIAQLPVNTPVTWANNTFVDNAAYTWTYTDPVTLEEAVSTDESLQLTLAPNYANAANGTPLYPAPVLTASAPGRADGSYRSFIEYYQAGGYPEVTLQDGTAASFGLLPFDIGTDGFDIMTAEPYDFGEPAVPIFGYSNRTEQWWTGYTFPDGAEEGEKSYINAYYNFLYTTPAPIVINGLWTQVKGQVSEGAGFLAEIILIDENFNMGETIATATCKGSDVMLSEGGVQNFLTLPFKFDEPVVISSEVAPAYIVKISGFNDPANVTYFAPAQSLLPNADELCFGWVEKMTVREGKTNSSQFPIAYIEGPYGDCYNSFMINLDAYYPWLTAADDAIELTEPAPGKEIALDSYHDAGNLTCTQADGSALPEWLHFAATGRYNSATATFTADPSATDRECSVVITAPGVSKALTVKQTGSAAIAGLSAGEANPVTAIYTTTGRRVTSADALPAGIYIVRYADGSTAKLPVR